LTEFSALQVLLTSISITVRLSQKHIGDLVL